jgi:hypothetical protein
MTDNQKPLLVTTEHKGVFFGYGQPTTEKIITLHDARMCVYWSADVHGVVGLAAKGPTAGCKVGPACPSITLQGVTAVMECSPTAGCKVGPACPSITLQGVTAVMECSPAAVKNWENEPWQ